MKFPARFKGEQRSFVFNCCGEEKFVAVVTGLHRDEKSCTCQNVCFCTTFKNTGVLLSIRSLWRKKDGYTGLKNFF